MSDRSPKLPGIEVALPGRKRPLRIDYVVFDFNGTLAVDGRLIRGVAPRLKRLAKSAELLVMTADTFGTARRAFARLPVCVYVVRSGAEKRRLVRSLGSNFVAAVGNGVNDVQMFRAAALGVAVMGHEGTAGKLLEVASVVVSDINDALGLLLNPRRLTATLRR